MGTPKVITLGCRLNTFESEVMREIGADAGLDNAIIINTCAVTAEAERQARQTIRRAKRDNPDARIIVTGCAAQLNADAFAAMAEVDRVLGNEEKLDPAVLAGDGAPVQVADIMTVKETAPPVISGLEGRTRAFVQIQQGCDHRCTYCIIPFARGPNRSVAIDAIIAQVRGLVDARYLEVVLTGVDICSYGADVSGTPDLAGLISQLLAAVPDLAISSGSACTSESDEASYVLRAIGLSNDLAESSLRFGLGRFTTPEDVDYAADRLIAEITRLRQQKQEAGIPARILDEVS